jgi:hypothetical protein
MIASWHNPLLVKFLIGAWVVGPFVGATAARKIFPRAVRMIDRAVIAGTLISTGVYGFSILAEVGWKPAAPFVVVPVGIWVLVAAAALIGR